MNILVVDDQPANRKLLRVQLEAERLSVVEAADGIEAMLVLARERIDAVISDILMPRMDGYRFCHEVRKSPQLRNIRFILYSSTYTAPADVRLSETVGADRFIAKPAPIAIILEALQAPPWDGATRTSELANEGIVLHEYSSVLVAKLEEKNTELHHALETSNRAHDRIQELNLTLEGRVRERTAELAAANLNLSAALAEVRELNRLLPICCDCKMIRDGKDYWENVESYIVHNTNSKFTHGFCPTCLEKRVQELDTDSGAAVGGKAR